METEITTNTIELMHYNEELSAIRKEFEVYKMELNYLKAKSQRIESYIRRDADDETKKESVPAKIKTISQIYEGQWQQK